MKLKPLIEKIGFSKHLSKGVEDVAADKFEDFGVTVGQLYQTFLKKDLTADPAIAQKIMDMVDTDDDAVLANQIKDLEFLINQLPDKAGPKDKIGFKEGVLNEDRYIVMWRRKDPEDLKKRGFDPEYPAFAPEAVKKGGWTKGREFMVSYGDFETPRDRAKAHAAKLEKEDGERVEYGVHLQRDNTRFEEDKDIKEFRRTGRQYKAQGQGGSAGNRRPGIMRGPSNYDLEDDDEEYTSKGDPNIDKGDFYDYSPYGFTIRFLGYEDGDDVIVRGNGFFKEKVKNGKVTFKSYPMKDAQGNRLEDAQGNRPGTPNSAYKLSDNYDESNIVDVLGNDHPFVVMTKSNHWKNNHSIDIDDNSISITLDTPNNLPSGLAPLSPRFSEGMLFEEINLDIQDNIATLSGDSGEYEGEIYKGKVSFSVIYDDLDTRITDQYDESNIEEFLGKNHAFVELSKKYDYNWNIEPDLVGITIKIKNDKSKLQELATKLGYLKESYHAIRGPIDVISQNLSMASSSEIKQIGQDVFGISPHDFGEDAEAIGDEIDNILVNSDDEEIEEYFRTYFGTYADEIAQEYGFYQNTNEMTDDEFSKAKEADRLEKHPEKDKIKKVQQLIRKQIKELWLKK